MQEASRRPLSKDKTAIAGGGKTALVSADGLIRSRDTAARADGGKDGMERVRYEVRVDELRMPRPPRSDLISRTAKGLAELEGLARDMASGPRTDVTVADFASMLGTLRQRLGGEEVGA